MPITRWIVLQKARRQNVKQVYVPPTPCTHIISGSISLPSRGSFRLSLTVLVRYRLQDIFSLGTWSSLLQSGFLVPRLTRVEQKSELKLVFLFGIHSSKNKICDTSHTGLSPSLAYLSRYFCSPHKRSYVHR